MSAHNLLSPMVAVALLAVVLAGCLGSEEVSPQFSATASGGALMTAWDYGAETLTPIEATLEVDVDEVTNTGTVRAIGQRGNDSLSVVLTEFVHNADDFHSGGIAANFDEHGDSGVGNALLPRMHLLLATWGPAQLMIDGNASVDPYTGSDVWDAHLMVTSTGVRGEDGKVANADGSGLYDPADPGNARIGEDTEAHLVISSTYANASLEPLNETFERSVDEPRGSAVASFDVPIPLGQIQVDVEVVGGPMSTGSYTFTLEDPDGDTRDIKNVNTVVPGGSTTTSLASPADKAGGWKLVGRSQATPMSFTADLTVTFPPKPMYYFFWEDVDVAQVVS